MSDESTEVSVGKDGVKIVGKQTVPIAIMATLVLSVLIAYMLWQHGARADERDISLVKALNDLSVAQRTQTCVSAFRREKDQTPTELLEFCKQFSR